MSSTTKVAAKKRGTKERIVDSAITLFNESGISAVTTNHVATHAGISPGNLYYYFANKEEIIREAFERVNAEADAIWGPSTPSSTAPQPKVDVGAFHRMLVGNLGLFAQYAFFARELPALLRADPVLRTRYAEIAKRRTEQLEDLLKPFIAAGLLRDLDDAEDLHALVETAWVLGLFCIPYAETLDPTVPPKTAKARAERLHDAIERGALLVLHLLRPHLDPMAYAALVVLVRTELHSTTEARG